MPVLKFLCPTTRVYFDSGVRLNERSAATSRLTIVRVRCAQCQREHRFLLADGTLDAPETLARRPAPRRPGAKSMTAGRSRLRRRPGSFGTSVPEAGYVAP